MFFLEKALFAVGACQGCQFLSYGTLADCWSLQWLGQHTGLLLGHTIFSCGSSTTTPIEKLPLRGPPLLYLVLNSASDSDYCVTGSDGMTIKAWDWENGWKNVQVRALLNRYPISHTSSVVRRSHIIS